MNPSHCCCLSSVTKDWITAQLCQPMRLVKEPRALKDAPHRAPALAGSSYSWGDLRAFPRGGIQKRRRRCSPWFLVASVTMTTIPFVSLNPKLLPRLANGIQVRQLCEDSRRMRAWESKTASAHACENTHTNSETPIYTCAHTYMDTYAHTCTGTMKTLGGFQPHSCTLFKQGTALHLLWHQCLGNVAFSWLSLEWLCFMWFPPRWVSSPMGSSTPLAGFPDNSLPFSSQILSTSCLSLSGPWGQFIVISLIVYSLSGFHGRP